MSTETTSSHGPQNCEDCGLTHTPASLQYADVDDIRWTQPDDIRWKLIEAGARTFADPWSRESYPDGLPIPNERERILAYAATKPLREYVQYDLDHSPGGDGLALADQDGDIAYASTANELRNTSFPVRVSIARGTDPAIAARLLRKAVDWIETGHRFDDPEMSRWPSAEHPGTRVCEYREP